MTARYRVALMQPYFLPYLGYWQLMQAVDEFIVYDTAQFSSGGWINRNRYRAGDGAKWFTIPVARSTHRAAIAERRVAPGFPAERNSILTRVGAAYRDAPFRSTGMELLAAALDGPNHQLDEFLVHSLEVVRDFLGIRTRLSRSGRLGHDASLAKEDRVIAISKATGATTYYSLSGGTALYSPEYFAEHGLGLRFRIPDPETESGVGERALSILDLVMRHDASAIAELVADARWTGSDRH